MYKCVALIELSSERFLKKLIGRTDIEDALKKLDKLTQEEARMATAQVMKATHGVDNRVRGVDDRVASVDERVKAVDRKIAEVIDGTRPVFSLSLGKRLTLLHLDGKEAKIVIQQTSTNVDQVKR
jgi:hypothetical protein